MDDGGRRPIPEWSDQPREYTLKWFLTWDQLAIWEGWYKYDLKNGANYGNVPIADDVDVEVMITSDPNRLYDQSRGHWEVSVTCISILPAPTIPVEGSDAPSWPSSLPDIEKEGYEYVTEGAIHPNISSGYQDGRMRWDRRRTDIKVRFILSKEQKTIFDQFIHNDLVGGLAYFYIPVAGGPGVKMAKAQFTEPPVVTPLGAIFQVNAVIDTFDLPELTEFEYKYGDGLTIEESFKLNDEVLLGRLAFGVDGLIFGEEISLSTTKPALDSVAFEDQVSYIVLYRRTLDDELRFSETISFNNKFVRTVPEDGVALGESGYVTTGDYYSQDYFAEDYFGILSTF
nr:hypothetical protein ART_00126 [Achromobacter phage vB_Ade_ART]